MRKRNLSEFMCIEMLYDYKLGKLDVLRQQAVEEGMAGSPRVREELRKLTLGLSFCQQLRETKVEEALIEYILKQPKPKERIFSNLNWGGLPQPVRWAIEAVVVAVAVSLFVIQVPRIFHRFTRVDEGTSIVKKFDIPTTTVEAITAPETVIDTKADGTKKTPEVMLAPVVTNEVVAKAPETKPVAVQAPSAPVAPAQQQVTAVPSVPVPVSTAEKPKTATKGNAYLYRMVLQSSNLDKVTPEIVTLITNLGGEKAGDVELGWRRRGGSYFHFSLPKANNPTFQEGLKKIGAFSITKSPHPRVMPEDTERFILWVEEKKSATPATKAIEEPAEKVQTQEPAQDPAPEDEAPGETNDGGNTDAQ